MRYQQILGHHNMTGRDRAHSPEQRLKGGYHTVRRDQSKRHRTRVKTVLLARALMSAVLCVVFVVVLKIYQDWRQRGNFSRTQKNILSTITTALSLALSINFIVSAAKELFEKKKKKKGGRRKKRLY
jgi:hypothetical protein